MSKKKLKERPDHDEPVEEVQPRDTWRISNRRFRQLAHTGEFTPKIDSDPKPYKGDDVST
jgi:hypothetical protein